MGMRTLRCGFQAAAIMSLSFLISPSVDIFAFSHPLR